MEQVIVINYDGQHTWDKVLEVAKYNYRLQQKTNAEFIEKDTITAMMNI